MLNDRESKNLLGGQVCAMKKSKEARSCSDYAVLPEFWNKGYATEMGKCCLDLGFEKHNIDSIIVFTSLSNHASARVIEKLGFYVRQKF